MGGKRAETHYFFIHLKEDTSRGPTTEKRTKKTFLPHDQEIFGFP